MLRNKEEGTSSNVTSHYIGGGGGGGVKMTVFSVTHFLDDPIPNWLQME